jgi:neutral ceramidase
MIRAGVAKSEITPPVGVRMGGFATRALPALAVHDPLWVRALVLDDGERRAALAALDVLGLSSELVAQVREKAASAVGIPPDGLLLAATHTHSGPAWVEKSDSDAQRQYWDALPEKVVAALSAAAADLVPAQVGAASGWSAVGINRREKLPGGNVELGRDHFARFDTELGVMRVEASAGAPLACVINYACHPVCLMSDNYLITADYPGFAVNHLEHALAGDAMGLFFNGACGNVNPREAEQWFGMVTGGSFRIAERAGTNLAREAARVWAKAVPRDDATLSFARREIELPTNRERAIRLAERALREAEAQAAAPQTDLRPYVVTYSEPDPDRHRDRIARLQAEGDSPLESEIQAVAVGPAVLLAWPGEIFCDLGLHVKESSPFSPTYVVGYANGYLGYVPTPEAFQEGGYETESAAHLADRAGLVLVEESLSLLRDLAASR